MNLITINKRGVVAIRLNKPELDNLDDLARQSHRSRGDVIRLLIGVAINRPDVREILGGGYE